MTGDRDAAREEGDLHDWLRRGTRAPHEALHALPAFVDLDAGRLDGPGYAALLSGLLAFWREMDALCSASLREHGIDAFGYAYSPRAALIAADLEACRAPLPPDRPRLIEPPASRAAAAGLLYVADGSLLGAAVMARAAARFAHPDTGAGTSYWLWCRANAGRVWPRTLALLPHCAPDAAARHDMLRAAGAAFDAFGRRFAPADPVAAG